MAEQAFMENKPPITIPVAEIEALPVTRDDGFPLDGESDETKRSLGIVQWSDLAALIDKYKGG